MAVNPPLSDVLGAGWALGVPIVGAAWSGDGAVGGVRARRRHGGAGARRSGRAARSSAASRRRRRGRARHRAEPPLCARPRFIAVPAWRWRRSRRRLPLRRRGRRLVRRGRRRRPPRRSRASPAVRVDCVAAGRAGWRAAASGCDVLVIRGRRQSFQTSAAVAALAFDPDGPVWRWRIRRGWRWWSAAGGAPRSTVLAQPSACAGLEPRRRLAGDRIGGRRCMAGASADGAMHDLGPAPGGLRSLLLCRRWPTARRVRRCARDVLASRRRGADRCRANRRRCAQPDVAGLRDRLPSEAVRWSRPDTSNGAVLLCQPGCRRRAVLRALGGGAVTALAWSRGRRAPGARAPPMVGRRCCCCRRTAPWDGARAEPELAR